MTSGRGRKVRNTARLGVQKALSGLDEERGWADPVGPEPGVRGLTQAAAGLEGHMCLATHEAETLFCHP